MLGPDIAANRGLLLTDLALVALTASGCAARWFFFDTGLALLGVVLAAYVAAKLIGYAISNYTLFQAFIDVQVRDSTHGKISGFALFKGVLVALLFLCFVLLRPEIWLVEAALVVAMRIWVRKFHACRSAAES